MRQLGEEPTIAHCNPSPAVTDSLLASLAKETTPGLLLSLLRRREGRGGTWCRRHLDLPLSPPEPRDLVVVWCRGVCIWWRRGPGVPAPVQFRHPSSWLASLWLALERSRFAAQKYLVLVPLPRPMYPLPRVSCSATQVTVVFTGNAVITEATSCTRARLPLVVNQAALCGSLPSLQRLGSTPFSASRHTTLRGDCTTVEILVLIRGICCFNFQLGNNRLHRVWS